MARRSPFSFSVGPKPPSPAQIAKRKERLEYGALMLELIDAKRRLAGNGHVDADVERAIVNAELRLMEYAEDPFRAATEALSRALNPRYDEE